VSSGRSATESAWWALGGLAAGVLLAAGFVRVRAMRLGRREDDPEDGPEPEPAGTEWLRA